MFLVQNNYVLVVKGMTSALQVLNDSKLTASCTWLMLGFTDIQILAITVSELDGINNHQLA